MKTLFFGCNATGAACLYHLVKEDNALVVTSPKDKLVHKLCTDKGIMLYEPCKALERIVDGYSPEIIYSVYYDRKIGPEILKRRVGINFHAGKLPDYRGCLTNMHMILRGEKTAVCTAHLLEDAFDSGDIVGERNCHIFSDDTGITLYNAMRQKTFELFVDTVEKVRKGKFEARPQVGKPRYYPRLLPNGGVIDLSWPNEWVDSFVRAFYFPPYKPARIPLGGINLYVNKVDISGGKLKITDSWVDV